VSAFADRSLPRHELPRSRGLDLGPGEVHRLAFGATTGNEIDTAAIAAWLRELEAEGKKRAP
jgi:hypothetical protein